MDMTDFIGQGIRFPMGADHRGGVALIGGPEALDRSIRMIVMTAPGERAMRPDFGCAIWDLLFSPVNENTLGLMAQAVRDAVGRWEPRVELHAVVVQPHPADAARVDIHLDYVVRETNDRRNLVHPFYLIPEEQSA